jgi:hypothetical protein
METGRARLGPQERAVSAVNISLIVFGLIVLSIVLGVMGRRWLPEAHLSGDSKDVIRLATALIGTMAAVVLALLFASTRTSYEATTGTVARMTTNIILLDHILQEYGPEGGALRQALRQDVTTIVQSVWTDDETVERPQGPVNAEAQEVTVLSRLQQMTPQSPLQATAQARALAVSGDLEQLRLTLLSHPSDSISKPFVTVLVIWLCFIFASFAMSAKPNTTLVIMLTICALSASSAIYLIIELGQPFDGLLQIPNAALRAALPPLAKT